MKLYEHIHSIPDLEEEETLLISFALVYINSNSFKVKQLKSTIIYRSNNKLIWFDFFEDVRNGESRISNLGRPKYKYTIFF